MGYSLAQKTRVIQKLIDNGYNTEELIMQFGLADIKTANFRNMDIDILIDLQAAIKENKLFSFLVETENIEEEKKEEAEESIYNKEETQSNNSY